MVGNIYQCYIGLEVCRFIMMNHEYDISLILVSHITLIHVLEAYLCHSCPCLEHGDMCIIILKIHEFMSHKFKNTF